MNWEPLLATVFIHQGINLSAYCHLRDGNFVNAMEQLVEALKEGHIQVAEEGEITLTSKGNMVAKALLSPEFLARSRKDGI